MQRVLHMLSQVIGKMTRHILLSAAFVLLVALFILDLQSGRELVPAIAYAVPVALSSLAHSSRLTLTLMGLSALATVAAGIENSLSTGFDLDSALNRVLATVSFTLVGVFALVVGRRDNRLHALEGEEVRAEREAELRHLLTDLSHHDEPHTLLTHTVTALPTLFGASKVVISAVQDGRLATPHYSNVPKGNGELCEGRLVPWVASLPVAGTKTASARLDGKLLTAGRLRRAGQDDLLVFVAGATTAEPCALLNDVLEGIEPLLEHAERLDEQVWLQRSRPVLS